VLNSETFRHLRGRARWAGDDKSPNRRRVLFGLAGAVGSMAAAPGPRLVVMVSGAFATALGELTPIFAQRTSTSLSIVLGASMGDTPQAIPNRLARGEHADVVILAREALDRLASNGSVRAGSEVDLVRSKVALAVKAGAPRPPISNAKQLRDALLAARSVAYSDSASGVYVSRELFARLGIADRMASKAAVVSGRPVGRAVAAGEYELGFQQLSELLPIEGITVVGLLPPEVQKVTVFSAGVAQGARDLPRARDLIGFLRSPAAAATIRRLGLEPAAMEPIR